MEMAPGDDGVQRVVIHYLVGGRLACMPGVKELSSVQPTPNKVGQLHPFLRSEEHRAVTCFLCKQTSAYTTAAGGQTTPGAK